MDGRCCLLALVALLSPTSAGTGGQCPLAVAPVGMVTARVGGHVALECGRDGGGGGDRGEAATDWTFNGGPLGAHHRRHLVNGSRLSVRGAQAKDTGNYDCARNGTLVWGVRLLVGVAPVGMVTARVGGDVVLECGRDGGGGDRGEAATDWTFNGGPLGAHHRRHLVNGSRLSVRGAQAKDTGNYDCARNGTLVWGVRLLVGEVPKTPRLSCRLKSYKSHVRCEWRSHDLKRLTRCVLAHRSSLMQDPLLLPCRFFTGLQVCVCTAPSHEDIYERFYMSLSVDNAIGCTASSERMFLFDQLLRPDAPVRVKARPVVGSPRWINISWSYPQKWSSAYYRLQFQVMYSSRSQQLIRTVSVEDTKYMIRDAFPEQNCTVRVRCKDEFDRGVWSAWSPELFVVPWADPRTNMIPEEGTEGLPSTDIEDELRLGNDTTAQGSHGRGSMRSPQLVPCMVGLTLLMLSVLSLLIIIRYWKKWKAKGLMKGQGEAPTPHQAVSLMAAAEAGRDPNAYEACSVETPLCGEPGDPPPVEEGGEGGPPAGPGSDRPRFHVANPAYYYTGEGNAARERESPPGLPN